MIIFCLSGRPKNVLCLFFTSSSKSTMPVLAVYNCPKLHISSIKWEYGVTLCSKGKKCAYHIYVYNICTSSKVIKNGNKNSKLWSALPI
jgi:hypothetical protein